MGSNTGCDEPEFRRVSQRELEIYYSSLNRPAGVGGLTAYADYEHCPGCDGKVIYTANVEVPDDVVCWHHACLDVAYAPRAPRPDALPAIHDEIEIYDVVLPAMLTPPVVPFPNRWSSGPSLVELDAYGDFAPERKGRGQ